MLSFVLRRLLWAVPTLVGISLVVFLLTSLLPEPAALGTLEGGAPDTACLGAPVPEECAARRRAEAAYEVAVARRLRFLDLPPFFNQDPKDVRARCGEVLAAMSRGGAEADLAELTLGEIGGAALPTVLPQLENLDGPTRSRVARALGHVTERMGVDPFALGTTEAQHLAFWENFWRDHVMDFTPGASFRAVDRLVRHGTELRANELATLDSYALGDVMAALDVVDRRDAIVQLIKFASRITHLPAVSPDATAEEIDAIRAQYKFYWYVHRTEFVPLEGLDLLTASLAETRYAKWTVGAFSGRLESIETKKATQDTTAPSLRSAVDSTPSLRSAIDTTPSLRSAVDGDLRQRLVVRGAITLGLIFLSLLGSHLVAIPLGLLAATRRGRRIDRAVSILLFLIYSLPTFAIAAVLRHAAGATVLAPVLTLSLGAAATLSRYQRAALLEVLTTDYVRTARAKGASKLRVLVVHALRNAVLPMIALGGVQVPQLLGGAFVVEEVWQIRGLGWETLRAIERRDIGWLIVVVCFTAIVATFALVTADFVQAFLDPRARETFRARGQA